MHNTIEQHDQKQAYFWSLLNIEDVFARKRTDLRSKYVSLTTQTRDLSQTLRCLATSMVFDTPDPFLT